MKYPKYKLAFPGKHVIVFKGHPMTQFGGYTLGTYASGNGIVSANKTKGFWGESAELFQSAADYYTFAGYSANKGTVNGNTYIFGKGNDIVTAFFNETEIYNLFLNQTQGGTITGNPMTGHSGQYIVLSALPSSHYIFNGYSVTGGVLSGDKIIIGNSDMTAQASWIEDPKYSLTITQTNGGKVTANKSTGYQGDQVTLSNTPSSHYTFGSYSLTGATLTGNKFNFVNQNVTAKGTFIQDPIRSVTLQQTNGGTVTASPMTGYDGTTVVLSNTANNGYAFSSYSVTGTTLTGNRFNLTGSNVTAKGSFYYADPLNPLNLPPYTIRVKFSNGYSPTANKGTVTRVTSYNENVWDITYQNNNWDDLFKNATVGYYTEPIDKIQAILGANTTNVTSLGWFLNPSKYTNDTVCPVTSVALFDTSNVEMFHYGFYNCKSLTSLPAFDYGKCKNVFMLFGHCENIKSLPPLDFSNAEGMANTFYYMYQLTAIPSITFPTGVTSFRCSECFLHDANVKAGISATYRELSSRNPTGSAYGYLYYRCFADCGTYTTQGNAERVLLPPNWKNYEQEW